MIGRRVIVWLACVTAVAQASAQQVVNWGAGTTAPSETAGVEPPVTRRAATIGPSREQPAASLPAESSASAGVQPPAGAVSSPVVSAPTSGPDLGSFAGYVSREGPEPSVRLDVGRVPPDLARVYAQQPGESEAGYIERMGALYRQMQAQGQAAQQQNAAYIRSLAPKPAPAQ